MEDMHDYQVVDLPAFFTESEHFKNWSEMFKETIFPLYPSAFLSNLEIKSQENLDKVIECESLYLFSRKARIQILSNIYTYWKEDPNSVQMRLPKEHKSWFANQVRALFQNKGIYMTLVQCMKSNYIDLFEYIYERDGPDSLISDSAWSIYPLLLYAIVNNNVEILLRGIEVGCTISPILLETAIERKSVEIVKILLNNGIDLSKKAAEVAAEKATREIFCLILDNFTPKMEFFIPFALNNIENLKELFLNRIKCNTDKNMGFRLLDECITNAKSLETVKFLEEYFELSLCDLIKRDKSLYGNIPRQVVIKDNLELYTYMYSCGFLVNESLIDEAIQNKCLNITPGLIRKNLRFVLSV